MASPRTGLAVLVASALALLAALTSVPPARAAVRFDYDAMQPYGSPSAYIAHELGSIDGYAYTNTVEAFERSYAKGFRLFECDLVRLRDGTVLVAHDHLEALYGLKKSFRSATSRDVAGLHYRGKYTVMNARRLIALLRRYPNARLILDTKWDHLLILKTLVRVAHGDRQVLDRLVPHVADQGNIDAVRAIYPFRGMMLATYRLRHPSIQGIIDLYRTNGLSAVMAGAVRGPHGGHVFPLALHRALQAARIPHYVYDVSTAADVLRARRMHVGVYSDGIYLRRGR
jgi:glycerophosphoryl diester phosphodiesterase